MTLPEIEALATSERRYDEQHCHIGKPRLRELLEFNLSRRGGTTEFSTSDHDPALIIESPHKFTITLSRWHSHIRDNWTIAHELGKVLLNHNNGAYPWESARYASGRKEVEANRFAAGYCLPLPEFKETWLHYHGNPNAVAGHFEVSVLAVNVRAEYALKEGM